MKMERLILWLLGGFLIGGAWGRPVDLTAPTSRVGSADINGDLQLWREVDGVGLQMSKGSYLPLRLKFSSAVPAGGLMGAGFYCPMFEAKNILIRERMMRAFLPCGKGLYLRRDTQDPAKFQTVDEQWTGLLDGDDFTIWRDDGWKVTYHQSRLTSIQTDSNHTFDWSYNNQGVATGVSEDGQLLIGVETDINGRLSAFSYGGKRYTVDFADRPSIEVVNGQTLVGKLLSSVSAFHYPDGRAETFKVLLAPADLVPTFEFTDVNKNKTTYTWNASTEHIETEKNAHDNWTYHIGEVTRAFDQPSVTRTNSDGKSESVVIDNQTGTSTEKALNGEATVRTVFKTPGPLYGKIRRITDTTGNVQVVLRFDYDEAGHLIRKIDTNGFTTVFSYRPDGQLAKQVVLPPSDPAILEDIRRKEEKLLAQIRNAATPDEKDDIEQQLAFFYIYQTGDVSKALHLIPSVNNRTRIGEIQMHAILGNLNLTTEEKVARLEILLGSYPTAKDQIESLIRAYQTKRS